MEEAILRIQPIRVLILKIQKSLRISDLQSMATESSSAIQCKTDIPHQLRTENLYTDSKY